MKDKIVLIGFMGSGKSTVAKLLADELELPCFDLDEFIETHEKKSISALFSQVGESEFRILERKYLDRFLNENSRFILATGGGTPCFFDSIDLINTTSTSFYLKVPADVLFHRLQDEKDKRPLLASHDFEAMRTLIEEKLKEREQFYLAAQFSIDAGFSPEEVRNEILQQLKA